jgi:hypothetical protein
MNEFNMELDGLQKVTYVKDIIVDYFTSRWGRRVVKYGEDGMYIYSKDYSYINRHRGIRHGWLEDNFNVKNIKDVYNVDRTDMPYDIDTDTPNSTRTP